MADIVTTGAGGTLAEKKTYHMDMGGEANHSVITWYGVANLEDIGNGTHLPLPTTGINGGIGKVAQVIDGNSFKYYVLNKIVVGETNSYSWKELITNIPSDDTKENTENKVTTIDDKNKTSDTFFPTVKAVWDAILWSIDRIGGYLVSSKPTVTGQVPSFNLATKQIDWKLPESGGGFSFGTWMTCNYQALLQKYSMTSQATLDAHLQTLNIYRQGATFATALFEKAKKAWPSTNWYFGTKTETASQVYYKSIISDSNNALYGIHPTTFDVYKSTDGGITWTLWGAKPSTSPAIVTSIGLSIVMDYEKATENVAHVCGQDTSNAGYVAWKSITSTNTTSAEWSLFVGAFSTTMYSNYRNVGITGYGNFLASSTANTQEFIDILRLVNGTFTRLFGYTISTTDTTFFPLTMCLAKGPAASLMTLVMISSSGVTRYKTFDNTLGAGWSGSTALTQSVVTKPSILLFNQVDKCSYCIDVDNSNVLKISYNSSGVPSVSKVAQVSTSATLGWNLVCIDNKGALIIIKNGTKNIYRIRVAEDSSSVELVGTLTNNYVGYTNGTSDEFGQIRRGASIVGTDSTKSSFYFGAYSSTNASSYGFTINDLYFEYSATATVAPKTESGDDRHYMMLE